MERCNMKSDSDCVDVEGVNVKGVLKVCWAKGYPRFFMTARGEPIFRGPTICTCGTDGTTPQTLCPSLLVPSKASSWVQQENLDQQATAAPTSPGEQRAVWDVPWKSSPCGLTLQTASRSASTNTWCVRKPQSLWPRWAHEISLAGNVR